MKLPANEISEEHIGMLCLFSYRTEEWGFTGHSHAHGLEGSGTVKSSRDFVGRLCVVTEESLHFLTWVEKSHPVTLSWTLGPDFHTDGISSISCPYLCEIKKKNIIERKVLLDGGAPNTIRQSLLKKREYGGVWGVGKRLAEYLPKL